MPRPALHNMAMEYASWHDVTNYQADKQFGVNLVATGLYQESTKGENIGKYFGVDGKDVFKIENNQDVDYNWIFHDQATNHNNTKATVKFDPQQTVYGLRLDYYQDLSFMLKNLCFKASSPFVRIENDMRMQITDAEELFADDNLVKYFAGNYEDTTEANGNLQAKLENAKIAGKKSTMGFADIDLQLGYKVLDQKRYKIALNLGMVVPTGNRVKGDYVFEPVRGNGRHFAFGGGLDTQFKLATSKKFRLYMLHSFNYRYLVKDTEKRTLSLNKMFKNDGKNRSSREFSQYYLLGKKSEDANQQLIPAANILTTDIEVTPGSQLESLTGFALKYKDFTFDIGYNVFFKEKETAKLKTNPFGNHNYGVAKPSGYSTENATAFSIANAVGDRFLTTNDLDLESALTPAQFTHKVYGGLGYAWDKKSCTTLFALGSSYEFATNNHELENWAGWAKLGFSF